MQVDQGVVAQARATTLRALTFSAGVSLVGGGLILGIGILVGFLIATVGGEPLQAFWLGPIVVPGLFLTYDGCRKRARIRRLRTTWAASGIAPVAMRFSPLGLRASIDAAPDSVFLPWSTVAGLRRHAWRGQQSLVIDLMPGVSPATPGVQGIAHPEVQRVLHRKVLGTTGLRVATRVLRQPVPEIDQALAAFTSGRLRIR
ncbi:hypothetical protein GCM10009765_03920 [Fodinicola feengrottensis]|uniref:Uncharacterized protein n=1 Tax=Fodinicola feengrottensis TaxID=435914 RepID=A0ABN2FSX4_9ACTN